MSSVVKSGISLSKKDLSRSRIPPVASRNVVFYHKASGGELSINLLALSMPSELPTMVQATNDEISGAKLVVNKKNLKLVSSVNDELIQGLHYDVTSATTIQLKGPYLISGAEQDEIFIGTINSAPISDLVIASARSVDKTYTLAVGSYILNLGREYKVGMNINDNIGSIKVFVNGVLAHRGVEYYEIDSGNGYGTTIGFYAAPASIPYSVAVDFGVMSITDNDAIGSIQALAGAVQKIAVDLADLASTNVTDYYSANPSEIERRTFGDMVLAHETKYPLIDNTTAMSVYTKTKWQLKFLTTNFTGAATMTDLTFNNLTIGKTYRMYLHCDFQGTGQKRVDVFNGAVNLTRAEMSAGSTELNTDTCKVFVAGATTLTFVSTTANAQFQGGDQSGTHVVLEELPNHEVTTQWT